MLIVGVGGTQRNGSSSELALELALEVPRRAGYDVKSFTGASLVFPFYDPSADLRTQNARRFLDYLRRADALVLASPSYHGSISGLIKNAIDYVEDLSDDERPYLQERVVGCISVGYSWHGASSTMAALRDIAHALRAWTTPYGATLNAKEMSMQSSDSIDRTTRRALHLVGEQVVTFLRSGSKLPSS